MQLKYLTIAGFIICGTAMHSIASIESEAVTARTKAMSDISDNMRVLGLMLKGKVDFNLVSAQSAIQNIEDLAAKTPALLKLKQSILMQKPSLKFGVTMMILLTKP